MQAANRRRFSALRAFAVVHALGAALGALAPAPARAQASADSATAQALFDEAKRLMAAKRYAEACPKLEESQRLDGGSGTLLNLASCYENSGRLASAWSAYLEAAAQARASGNATRETAARDFANKLAPRLSRLELKVAPDARVEGLELKRDGTLVGQAQWGLALPVDAGAHVITASAPGRAPWETRVTAGAEGSTVSVVVPVLAPGNGAAAPASPAAAPVGPPGAISATTTDSAPSTWPTQRTFALVAAGVGLVGVGVGSVFGLQSMSHHDDAEKAGCSGDTCPTNEGVNASGDARSAGTISTIGFIVGTVGLAAGGVLWFTTPAQPASEHARLRFGVGPGSLQLSGSY